MENATVDPQSLAKKQKALGQPLLPCREVKRTALLAKHQTRLPWFPLIRRFPLSLGFWYHERPTRGSRQTGVRFQSPIPSDSVLWSPQGGHSPDSPGSSTVCVPYRSVGLLGWAALNLADGCHCSAPSGHTERWVSRPPWTSKASAVLCRQCPWASETRLRAEGRQGLDLLPRFYFYVPKIVNGLCWWYLRNWWTGLTQSFTWEVIGSHNIN